MDASGSTTRALSLEVCEPRHFHGRRLSTFCVRKINEGTAGAARGDSDRNWSRRRTEREQALAKVAEADNLLSRLDDDVRTVHEQADRKQNRNDSDWPQRPSAKWKS